MSRSRIKTGTHKKKVRGFRQQQAVQRNERIRTQHTMQEQAHRRRMTRTDVDTGEAYTLTRLGLKDNTVIDEYRDGLSAVVDESAENADSQAAAIQAYLQAWVDDGRLVPIACERGAKPVCRVYKGEGKRVVVIRQNDPDVEK